MKTPFLRLLLLGSSLFTFVFVDMGPARAAESRGIYGIFDYSPDPSPYLDQVTNTGNGDWITATVAVGANSNDMSGMDFTTGVADKGYTVVCRINNGYFPDGTIPLPSQYAAFAVRCANFVKNSPGCSIWVIGNECNIQGEWPFTGTNFAYVSPTNYAACFRLVYTAIKAVHPNDKVVPQGEAPFAGPYGAGTLVNPNDGQTYEADGVPINWVQYMNQMLTAIQSSGPLDGICLHINSRGYDPCLDVFSTQQVNANEQNLYFSFYCYKDWINYGIPSSLYNLPLYATECNGYYYWAGGHPENPEATYEPGWMQQVYAEINRYNQFAIVSGKPVFHCVNMYRWCQCDGWAISGEPYESQILSDLADAASYHYTWPTAFQAKLPIGINFVNPSGGSNTVSICNTAGVVPMQGWVNLPTGGTGTAVPLVGNATVTWTSTGGGTHTLPIGVGSGDTEMMADYLDTGDSSTDSVNVSGLSFPKYNVYVYADGDNGGASRVGKYTLSVSLGNNTTKYLMDAANVDFSGAYTQVDSSTGGPSTPAGNYIVFSNITTSSFTLTSTSTGQYSSDGHPRAPINGIEIVPVTPPTISILSYNASQSQLLFYVDGVLNYNYSVETSTDLIHWVSIGSASAPFTFTENTTGTATFYRASY